MRLTTSGSKVILHLKGSIEHEETEALELKLEDLLESGKMRVVVDLTEVNHLSSMGLGVLVSFKKLYHAQQGDLKLVIASEELAGLFKVTMLNKVFDISETRKDALSKF